MLRRRRGVPEVGYGHRLYELVVAGDEAAWTALALREEQLARATAEDRTAFGIDVVETVQNLLSHADSPVRPEEVRERLGPTLRRLWDELDAHWTLVAHWVDANGRPPTGPTLDDVLAVEDPTLSLILRGSYRALPGGRWVTVADCARRELASGVAFTAS
ncbi:MAG TPA: hypothetical protein VF519_13765 [Mycobacteriales bacterium]|jgi:hypothetical protein